MTPQPRENGAVALPEAYASIGVESGKLVRELGRAAVTATMAFARHSEETSPIAGKSAEASGGETADCSYGGFFSQARGMIAALSASRQRNTMLFLFVALMAVVGATAFAQVQLNAWNEPFYDALARKNFSEFAQQLIVFAELAGVLLALNVAQTWLNQKSKLVLREGLVEDLLAEWLSPLRAIRLSHAGEIGANPDQRIQEDAKHLTEMTTDLWIGLLQSTLLLLCFIGVLWILSDRVVLAMAGFPFVPQGYMVWCALIYAGVASFVSWRVGRPLIQLNAERYAREADFQFRARPRQRKGRRDHAIWRRGGRKGSPPGCFQRRRRGLGAVGSRGDRIDLGDGWLRLVHDRRADPRRRAGLFPERDDLWRTHDARSAPSIRCSRRFDGSSTISRPSRTGGRPSCVSRASATPCRQWKSSAGTPARSNWRKPRTGPPG